jgi:hypothetical protein
MILVLDQVKKIRTKDLMFMHFVAIKQDDGNYFIVKDRYKGRTGIRVTSDLLSIYISEFLNGKSS